MAVAQDGEKLLARFPNAAVNPEERRRIRAALCQPLLKLSSEERARVVELTMAHLVPEGEM
jgi:type I restriction enzyme, R subunit